MAGWLLLAFVVALAIDQLSKHFVTEWLVEGQQLGDRRVRLRRLTNRGGLALIPGRFTPLLLWVATSAVVLAVALASQPFHGVLAQVGLGLALGGAAGNAADLPFRKGIVAFIDVRVWPVFNLADVALVGGLGLAVSTALLGSS